jgi:ParB/RepB/Spo0J family partition protein
MVSKLIADKASALDQTSTRNSEALIIPIGWLKPNPNQPRRVLDEERDLELAENIRENGILEPLIVREIGENQYEIVAGERRYRAATLVGKPTVPVIVKEYDDQQSKLVAVIENLQRVDLDPLDEAYYFKFLSDNYNYSYRKIAGLVHRSYSYVNDRMRLLDLSENNPTNIRDEFHNRQENNQKLQNSQSSRTSLPKRPYQYSPKSVLSFTGWLDKTRNSLSRLKDDEKSELKTSLAELRSKIAELEKEL